MKEKDRIPTSFLFVVLTTPILDLDVQAPSVKEILQETQQKLPFFYKDLLSKEKLLILNYTT